jgi:hypothetical protein
MPDCEHAAVELRRTERDEKEPVVESWACIECGAPFHQARETSELRREVVKLKRLVKGFVDALAALSEVK